MASCQGPSEGNERPSSSFFWQRKNNANKECQSMKLCSTHQYIIFISIIAFLQTTESAPSSRDDSRPVNGRQSLQIDPRLCPKVVLSRIDNVFHFLRA